MRIKKPEDQVGNYNEIIGTPAQEEKEKLLFSYTLLNNMGNKNIELCKGGEINEKIKKTLDIEINKSNNNKIMGDITLSAVESNLIYSIVSLAQEELIEKGAEVEGQNIILDLAKNHRDKNGVRISISLYKLTQCIYKQVGTYQIEKVKETINNLAAKEFPVVTYYNKYNEKTGKIIGVRAVRKWVHLITLEKQDIFDYTYSTNKVSQKREFNILLDEVFYNRITTNNISVPANFMEVRRSIKGFNSDLAQKMYPYIVNMIQCKKEQVKNTANKNKNINIAEISKKEGYIKKNIKQLIELLYHEKETTDGDKKIFIPVEIRKNDIKKNMDTLCKGFIDANMITDYEYNEKKEEYKLYLNLNWSNE